MVPRAIACDRRLNPTEALVWAIDAYRRARCGSDSNADVAGWIGMSDDTVWRARGTLRGFAGPVLQTRGALKVVLAEVRKHGVLGAFVLAELRVIGQLGMIRRLGDRLMVPARLLARLVGCCAKTASSVLRRLAGAVLEVLPSRGRACVVRVLGERERIPAPATSGFATAREDTRGVGGYPASGAGIPAATVPKGSADWFRAFVPS